MSKDIYQLIAQTGYHHQGQLHIIRDITPTQDITLDPLLDIITGTDTSITGPDHSHTPAGIEVTVEITCTTATPDHITDTPTEAPHVTITLALIIIAMTHPHRRLSSHRSSSTHSRDHNRSRTHTPYKPSKTTCSKPSSSSSRTTVKHQDKKHRRVTIDDPQSDYYSSADTSSKFEDDLN